MAIITLLFFLAWGSYLNSLAYRLLNLEFFFNHRSFCPSCKHPIAWYDNIPVFSWLWLKARCRSCHQKISWLYPFIEIITTTLLFLAWQTVLPQYFISYFIFFSALIVTIRTDFDEMLISRFVTMYLIPVGLLAVTRHELPLSLQESLIGIIFGYGILWCTQKISLLVTKQEGLGQGDLELLAFIGAFTGPFGCWIALLVGSLSGIAVSLIYMAITKQRVEKVPLGSYLSFGAMIFVLFQDFFAYYFFL